MTSSAGGHGVEGHGCLTQREGRLRAGARVFV